MPEAVRQLDRVEWVAGQVPLPGLADDAQTAQPTVADLLEAEASRLVALGLSRAVANDCAQAYVRHRRRTRLLRREHGSERGYQQHRYDGTPTCTPCKDAHAQHNESPERRTA